MNRKIIYIILFCSFKLSLLAQYSINGSFPLLANSTVVLNGFNGSSSYAIDSVVVSATGNFNLKYPNAYNGLGYILDNQNKGFFVILDNENIQLAGEMLSYSESVHVIQGKQNQLLQQYAKEYPRRDNTLSAWIFLERIYRYDSLFLKQRESVEAIQKEKNNIYKAEDNFFNSLAPDSYIHWYLPLRKLASSVNSIAQNRYEEVPATIEEFRKLDYTDPRWNKSDLYTEIFEKHFWLLENSGGNLDSVYNRMKISLDIIFANLANDEKKYNEIGNFLFDLLEKRSLFAASEYMALKLLSQNRCTLDENFAKELETYRIMRTGNIAPDITFTENTLAAAYPPAQYPTSLYDLKSDYKLVIFGAGWCNSCIEELPKVASMYNMLKEKNMEVVFVSLDNDIHSFTNFAGKFPFISTCDFKGWNSPIAEKYYVSATPTMFLLDKDNKILLRPNSAKHLDAWIEWYIK